jgi:hypothetical protein
LLRSLAERLGFFRGVNAGKPNLVLFVCQSNTCASAEPASAAIPAHMAARASDRGGCAPENSDCLCLTFLFLQAGEVGGKGYESY